MGGGRRGGGTDLTGACRCVIPSLIRAAQYCAELYTIVGSMHYAAIR